MAARGALVVVRFALVLLAGLAAFVPKEALAQETTAFAACRDAADFRLQDRGVELAQLDAPRAIALCEAALAEAPDDPFLLAYLGRALAKAERYDEAFAAVSRSAEAGNPNGQNYLGFLYDQLAGDYVEAIRWYRLAAGQGYAPAQRNLGAIYEYGLGVPQDNAEAVRWYLLAAGQGFAGAQADLGRIYYYGVGVPQDYAAAVRWYRMAGEQGYAAAQTQLAYLYNNGFGVAVDNAEAMRWAELAAEQGDAAAQYLLGFNYLFPDRAPPDYVAALRWLRLSAEQGDARAQSDLAYMYANGLGVAPNDAEAVRLYLMAAEQGQNTGQWGIDAYCRLAPLDLSFCFMAAEAGNLDAQRAIAANLTGDNLSIARRREALRWYEPAAGQGDPLAQLGAGRILQSIGSPADILAAEEWFRRAANQGLSEAQFALAQLYDNGLGAAVDPAEIVGWYVLAANQELPEAQFLIDRWCIYDAALPDALPRCQMAADLGAPVARYGMAVRYRDGVGLPRDVAEGLRWARLAAKQGHAEAQHYLGVAYRDGVGVTVDREQAQLWFKLATDQGLAAARASLTSMLAGDPVATRDPAIETHPSAQPRLVQLPSIGADGVPGIQGIVAHLTRLDPRDANGGFVDCYVLSAEVGRFAVLEVSSDSFLPALEYGPYRDDFCSGPLQTGSGVPYRSSGRWYATGAAPMDSGLLAVRVSSRTAGTTGQYLVRFSVAPGDLATPELREANRAAFALLTEAEFAGARAIFVPVLQGLTKSAGPLNAETLLAFMGLSLTLFRGEVAAADAEVIALLDGVIELWGAEAPGLATVGEEMIVGGDLRVGAFLMERALAASQRYLGPDHPDTIDVARKLGVALYNLGRFPEAEEQFTFVAAAAPRVLGEEHPTTLGATGWLALALRDRGMNMAAQAVIERSINAREAAFGPGNVGTIADYLSLATLFFEQKRYGESLEVARHAVDLGTGEQDCVGYSSVGVSLVMLARYDEAEMALQRAIELCEALHGPDAGETLSAVHNLGLLRTDQGRYAEAVELFQRVVDAERSLPVAPRYITSLRRLAGALRAADQVGDALAILDEAELRAGQLADAGPDMAAVLEARADILLGQGLPERALESARLALDIRRRIQDREGGLGPGTQGAGLYEATEGAARLLLEAAFQQYSSSPGDHGALLAEAFEAAQLVRFSGAASAFAHASGLIAAGRAGLEQDARVLAQYQLERDALQREYAATFVEGEDTVMAAPTAGIPAVAIPAVDPVALRASIQRRQNELDGLIAAIEARLASESPAYFDLIRPAPVSLATLRAAGASAMLHDDEVLILLTQGDDDHAGIVFAITRDDAAWARIGMSASELRDAIARLRADLDPAMARGTLAGGGSGDFGFDSQTAHDLYEALFGDPSIRAVTDGKQNWILAPQGDLVSLPFAIVVIDAPMGTAGPMAMLATRWLGLEKTLSLVPAVSTVHVLRGPGAETADPRQAFFGLADPDFDGAPTGDRGLDDPALYRDGAGNPDRIRALPALPGTRRELLAVANALGAREQAYLLGPMANETRLVGLSAEGTLANARVIHFATHGLLGVETGFDLLAEPALALSPPLGPDPTPIIGVPDDPGRVDDGLLTATEAARLRLNADWVILSACNTAAGDVPGADGLSGLARGFLFAGAESLLVSHWPVADDAAAALISRTVILAEGGMPRAEALRQAMSELMHDPSQRFVHPAFWAPFVFVGVN